MSDEAEVGGKWGRSGCLLNSMRRSQYRIEANSAVFDREIGGICIFKAYNWTLVIQMLGVYEYVELVFGTQNDLICMNIFSFLIQK